MLTVFFLSVKLGQMSELGPVEDQVVLHTWSWIEQLSRNHLAGVETRVRFRFWFRF